MIPTIFPANYIPPNDPTGTFPKFPENAHGTVDLIDCLECIAEQTEDEDGAEWELAFKYPLNGYGYEHLSINAIVLAKVNDHQDPQAFRIYSIEKNIAKTVTVSCQHISYDLVNIPVKNYKATDAASAVSGLQSNAVSKAGKFQNRFYITTDIVNSDDFALDTPSSMRAALLDGEDSIKGTYGGDLIFDNYRVELKQVGGEDRDVTINYGVDLIDMTQEESISEMITGILGYYKRSTTDEQYASNPVIYASDVSYGPGEYTIQRIEPIDLSEHFPESVPTPAQLKTKADEWVTKEKVGEPEISLTVRYATLGQDVRIHDAVCVKFPKLFADPKGYKAKVVKYKYNVLLERCEEIEVGHAKAGSLFNLMDASKLRKGLIPPARIQNESITDNKIAKGGVGKGKIGPEAINEKNIQKRSLNHELMSQKDDPGGPAIKTDNLDDGAVTGDKIHDGAVGEGKIGANAVDKDNIKNGAVTTPKIEDLAVQTAKIAEKAISEGRLADAAVAFGKLKSGTGQPATVINNLSTQVAYINTLFTDNVWASSFHATKLYTTDFYYNNSQVYNAQVPGLSSSEGFYVLATGRFVR